MTKFRLTRRKLSPEEAHKLIQNAFQMISTHWWNIMEWQGKVGKPLSVMDAWIIHQDGLTTAQEFIEMSQNEISYLTKKIYEDYGRFTKVVNTVG